MLFGEGRVSRGMHFFARCMVAFGSLLSACWIIAANSWMQTPAGAVARASQCCRRPPVRGASRGFKRIGLAPLLGRSRAEFVALGFSVTKGPVRGPTRCSISRSAQCLRVSRSRSPTNASGTCARAAQSDRTHRFWQAGGTSTRLEQEASVEETDASDEHVLRAIGAASCSDFINALPEGIGTVVGNRGIKLSPGQRQRIAIARAFLKDAPILLLDEATSTLDTESEEVVRRALDRLMRGRTVVAIAHRLLTLRNFDRIVVLQGGRIIQDGTPQTLISRAGISRDLVCREMARLSAQAA
jgi:ABC-type branched-subunit amino acid transport system ATPase component